MEVVSQEANSNWMFPWSCTKRRPAPSDREEDLGSLSSFLGGYSDGKETPVVKCQLNNIILYHRIN